MLQFIGGVIVGAVIMFFVYGNNKKKMTDAHAKVSQELYEAKAKIKEMRK